MKRYAAWLVWGVLALAWLALMAWVAQFCAP